MPACGRRSSSTRRVPSIMAATADLLSAPRIVPAALRITPSSSTGSIDAGGGAGAGGGGEHGEGGEEEERPPALGGRREPAEEVAHRRADRGPGAVLVHLEPERAQLLDHTVGDRALLARPARPRWLRGGAGHQ